MFNRLKNWLHSSALEPARIEETPVQMSKLRRGVGICRNADCEEHNKDIFLVNHGNSFVCPRCRKQGFYLQEQGTTLNNTSLDFYQVRVEFNYSPHEDRFRSIAIVTDESMPKSGGNVYTLKTPLIRTDKRALEVATALLGNLMQATEEVFDGSGLGRPKEHVLYFDNPRELFQIELDLLGQKLENSRLRRKQ